MDLDHQRLVELADLELHLAGLPGEDAPDDGLHLAADRMVELARRQHALLDQNLTVTLVRRLEDADGLGQLIAGPLAGAVEVRSEA